MNTICQYDTEIEKWLHVNVEKFIGQNFEHEIIYELSISEQDPQDPDCCYFNIWVEKKIDNLENGTVFHAKARTTFKVQNNKEKPPVDFFFNLIELSTSEFEKIYYHRTQKTNLAAHKIPKVAFVALREDIQKCIYIWDMTIRNASLN